MRDDPSHPADDGDLNLGPQPIARLLADLSLSHHDLVAASTEQITHKMVARAAKGRRLSRKVQVKVLNALNAAAKQRFALSDLFNYAGRP
ncbi:MAG: hypothetical protein KGS60_01495 [Verrucomicrobia bacterium]|nr:hypothetical protein [Verrucomicrobiota bacterium]